MMAWLGANKDALLALAAVVVSPAVALFGVLLSQRNMARSLAIQGEAMEKNLDVAVRQLVNAERQFRMQASIASAGILGAIQRAQLETFITRCARLLQLHEEVANKEARLEKYADSDEFVRLHREMDGIAAELKLLVPEGVTAGFFHMEARDLIMTVQSRDIGRRLKASEAFVSRAREIAAQWRAAIGGLVDDGAEPTLPA